MILITFMQNEFINTTVLPDKKKGRYKLSHSMSGFSGDINIDGKDNKWMISEGRDYSLYRTSEDNRTEQVAETILEDYDVLIIEINGVRCTLIAEKINDEKNRFTKLCFASSGPDKFSIGKNKENDIVLDDVCISGSHADISYNDGKWSVTDHKSSNGTYVNNRRIDAEKECVLKAGDVVFIVGYKFIICSDFIAANIDYDKTVRGKQLRKVVFPENTASDKKNTDSSTEYFYRTIDLGEKEPEIQEITLMPPERSEVREEQSALATMGSALTMSSATVLVAGYSALAAYYRGSNMSYVVPSFIMAGSMILSSLIWPSVIRKQRKKSAGRKEAERIKNYQDYIMDLRASVNVMMDNEKNYLCRKYLTVDECMARVIQKDKYLWSKSINDEDFMSVAVGTGKLESSVQIKFNDDNDKFFKDDLRYDMMQFAHDDRIISDVPISVSLNNGCICGINGDKAASAEIIKEIVVQLASLYSYDELKLVFIFDEDDDWDYVKWLPHVWNKDNTFRYIASSPDDIKELSTELEKEIDYRISHKEDDFPKMLIIASDKKMVESIDIMSVILKQRKQLDISILTAFGIYNYNNSDIIIELSEEGPKVYDRTNNKVRDFVPYKVNEDTSLPVCFEKYLDMISNIKLDISTEKYQLPKMLTFLDMFRVSKVEHLNSLSRWSENNPIKSLKTEIGVAPSGDTFFIDMHEKYHGPHGLVAGTTGSGKSESIITVILSLAVNYSPEEVAFVIIDYKGGGLADAFNDVKEEIVDSRTVEVSYKLPHVVGTVTNLDGATIERACISIETEIKRRQLLFKTARKLSNDGTMDIYKYQKLRREGADLEALPHLFIVCDEFAELKDDRPDFMELLVSAARIGRSLGVHLILATQKPDTVVSPQIWSNSRFKICLKVQGKEDSKAVIHCPDAAEISTTGRFFFQVGYNEVFSMGQSAWCGADYIESDDFIKSRDESVEIISSTGAVLHERSKKPDVALDSGSRTVSQLIAVRNYLIDIAKDIEVRPLWLAPIPAKLSVRSLCAELGDRESGSYTPLDPVIGKRDDLYNRIQEIMTIPFAEKGNLIIYGAAGSGLDMFFVTLLYSLIHTYDANQVNIYVLDFDAGFLKTYQKAPQVGDVVTAEDEDDVRTVIDSVKDEIRRRGKLFSEYRGEYEEYCRHSGQSLPNVVLILNNYTDFIEKYDDSVNSALVYIAREGVKRGVYLVIGTVSANTNFRLRQYIQQTLMLRMNDPNDYIGILGRTGGITPSAHEGSGIVKEDDVTYKFQVADIFDVVNVSEDDKEPTYDAGKEIKELCARAQERCGDVRAASFKHVEITVDAVMAEPAESSRIPLGVCGDEVLYYDFSDKYITFVSGLSENHLTGFAGYLAKVLATDSNISVKVLDPSGALRQEDAGYTCYSSIEDFDLWNKEFKAEAESRCAKLVRTASGECVMSEAARHIYVIINSFMKASSIEDKNVTFNNLKLIINELPEIHYHYIILDTPASMKAERGAYIHIVKNLDDVSNFDDFDKENNREWFDASGIWLDAGVTGSGLFDITNGRPSVIDGEAIVIRNRISEKKFRYFS